MAKVTIETNELTLSNVSAGGNYVEPWHVVQLIDKLVRAMDAAHPAAGQHYNVRLHLMTALEKDE
jgi:hypothetical protein